MRCGQREGGGFLALTAWIGCWSTSKTWASSAGAPRQGRPFEELAERYRWWLVTDRGLAEATVVRYVKLARLFLNQRLTGRGGLESLSGADVVVFLLAESERLSVGSVKGRVGELRSLLRFLYLQGLTPRSLAAAVPPVAGWRDTGVPKAIPPVTCSACWTAVTAGTRPGSATTRS